MNFNFFIFVLFLYINLIDCLTNLPTEISENRTLTLENSPYISNEDVIVRRNARLTIEPGCELRFAKGKQLIIYGTLIARGTSVNRIRFTKLNDLDESNSTKTNFFVNSNFRLVEGETIQDGKLQINYNSKWHYVCSTQFNWTETDVNVTCKSLGFSNGTFYYYSPSNNLTSHMKMFTPRCKGHEKNLFECPGSVHPELGLTVCDTQNVVGLVCEGFDNQAVETNENWGGIVFQKYAPFLKTQEFTSIFYNLSQSILEYVDIRFAGLISNKNPLKPKYNYMPTSAVTVFQYAPKFDNLLIEHSIGNGLNYSNIEAPGFITNSIFRYNRGHGIAANTRFGNLKIENSFSYSNLGDGLKYSFNNTVWTQQEQEEYFVNRYIEYCDSPNPLSFPAYYKYKNPNYVRECTKTFSTPESDQRITLHFQKINIKSKYSTYWLEVYDGQTEKNSLIANYTFQDGKTPEAIYSRTNYMYVKIKFKCNLASNRKMQPVELKQLKFEHQWNQFQNNQNLYEQKVYKYNNQIVQSLSLGQLSFREQQQQLNLLEKQQKEEELKFKQNLEQKQLEMQQSRTACPYTMYDEITMYAMIGSQKNPDLLVRNSQFINNSLNGINATNLHSLIQLNETLLKSNHMNGLHVQAGAGDVSLYHSRIESNSMNGVNITYAGGLREFNYTRVVNNGLYGIYTNYRVEQEFDNIFQNTTLNGSLIESNILGGVYLGAYCNQSNITINSTVFRQNQEDGLIIESCRSKKYLNFTHLNISWNLFDSNRLNGLKILNIQNMIGVISNNTFQSHRKGALLITQNSDSFIQNVSIRILYNKFYNNSGRYALNVALNNLADIRFQSINITFNRFELNRINEPYEHMLNPRSSVSAVAVVSAGNVAINQNWFNNPQSRLQLATHLDNFTTRINASLNWFQALQPVYDLHYFMSHRDKCNQQWLKVRQGIFDNSNRSNLAQIIYWPFSCNERMWIQESSIDLPPPADFDISDTNNLGGVYDLGDSVLPVNRYTVTNDILIKPGAKLTIKSGTELNFLNGVGMLVLGELQVEGHFSSLVKFTSTNRPLRIRRAINGTNLNSTISRKSFRISLVDGNNFFEGRLRLEINGKYGTVCNRGWSIENSKIVCQQMGLVLDPSFYLYSRWLENDHRKDEAILMSEVQCDPLDTSIFECRHTRHTEHSCTHQDDVWLKCLRPSWAGVRFGLSSQSSSVKYALFENAGQYDYAQAKLEPALRFDFLQHDLANLTFQHNQHVSLEILFNHAFRKTSLNNLNFLSNNAAGLVTRTSYLRVNQVYGQGNEMYPVVEYNPFFSVENLNSIRLYSSQPRRGYDVRRELTRLEDNTWFIGAEQMVMLYTDTEYDFGPREFNIQIKTDNNRVLIVELIDFNTNFEQEKVIFCERMCQQSYADPASREWNLSIPENTIYFPINTSYSVLHINYNVTSHKSGRLAFIVYSAKAPELVYDYKSPSSVYLRNIMPENILRIHNSTFNFNRHSIVLRHYDDSIDIFGNLKKRYNYSNIIVSNCTFYSNDQTFWINTDPVFRDIHQRVNNLTVHVPNSLTESNKDDFLVSETGYRMFDLVPSVKLGPFGKINVTFEDCIFKNNYGGIRALYRYHEHSNTIWHYEIRNNKFLDNKQSVLKLLLPRLYRFAIRNEWENTSHSLNLRNNEFASNDLFEISLDGYYAQVNITKNLFYENDCRLGLVKFSGTEKDFFIYNNKIERNRASFIFDLEAKSHAHNDFDYPSLLVENEIVRNVKLVQNIYTTLLHGENSPTSYTIALRGIQNCTINKNLFENDMFDYELVGALQTNTLNSTIDASLNWWGTADPNIIKKRIFDLHEWNNHALVNFIPYYADKIDFSLSRRAPEFSVFENQNENILSGVIYQDMTLSKSAIPYIVKSDLTIMPGASLYINPGVEMEFYPNVGILVLGDLRASGTQDSYIKMRPVKNNLRNNKINLNNNEEYLKKIRFFSGLNQDEGFLQVFNSTLRSWTFICDRQFTLATASVVCKQMGKEYRNPLVKSLFHYMAPNAQPAVLNQTFICQGSEQTLEECDTFANYHAQECQSQEEYTYVMCKGYNLDKEHSWGGIRFAQPYFETYSSQQIGLGDRPIFLKGIRESRKNIGTAVLANEWRFRSHDQIDSKAKVIVFLRELQIFIDSSEFQQQPQDLSYMYYVDILGAGRLHNEPSPSVQLIYRTPMISNCNIRNSTYHGLEFMQSKTTAVFNKLKIESSLGYGVNSLQLNVQTTDQKSSFKVLTKNTLSTQSLFSMVDICDPHKYYDLDQRIIIYYKYSSLPRDCAKIFRTRISPTNLGGSGQIGIRFLQVMLVNNTVQNDTIEIFNGTLFKHSNLMTSLSNGSSSEDFEKFYLSKTNTLSVFMKASIGREYFGFIAEVLIYPTSQYLLTDTYIELSDSEIKNNLLGALSFVSAGERNPHFYLVRNRFVSNGFEYFNSTSPPSVDITLQNAPKFYFGNNYINQNYGGVSLNLHSGSGVLITSSLVYNNLFLSNKNDTALCTRGGLQLPYNEITIDKNLFLLNESPRTDIVLVSGLISKFTRNQLVYNKGARILFTQGFENVSTPRSQDISFNLLRDNYAYGILNELEDPNRFRSTMVAASLKQIYYSNYLFNKDNDFELTALVDPLALNFLLNYYTTSTLSAYKSVKSQYRDEDYFFYEPTTKSQDISKLYGMIAYNGAINASNNYWSSSVESEIRARIRDKYDNATLFEVSYSPPVVDEFRLRDGKCELGWSLIDDTCYTYVGSYVTYKEAEQICKKFESRLARETVAPIKLPRFRKLARQSQFDYETQSYRKIWLYSSLSSECSVIEDFGVASANCNDILPFICEKDPVFSGAAFRFKDEIAFAIAAIAALIVLIILLCLLWICKSRKRKKEHIDRKNTLRNSARQNRQIINNSAFSTLNSNKLNLNNNNNNKSFDNLSTTMTRGGINGGSRSVNGGIYNSQRNQYFANKKHKKNNEITSTDLSKNDTDSTGSGSFNASGLDANQASSYYGTANETKILNPSIQYHVLDTGSTNKSSIKYGELENDDDLTTTTTEELVDDQTKSEKNRFKLKGHSPGDSSNKTILTTDDLVEKEFIQAKLIKTNISPIETKLNSFVPSYDQLMNTTMTTDTEDDFQDGNSRRLLTSKVNTSTMKKLEPKPVLKLNPYFETGSIASKSTSNMTNVSPMPTNTEIKLATNLAHSSDYENLSNSAINDILTSYPDTTPRKTRNVYTSNNSNLLQVAAMPRSKPRSPAAPPPQLPSQFKHLNSPRIISEETDDNESMMSCQLITSASLLLNRENVREAKKITENVSQEKFLVPPMRNGNSSGRVPIFSPRQGNNNINQYDVLNPSVSVVNKSQDANVQFTQTDSDATKPPPMETAI